MELSIYNLLAFLCIARAIMAKGVVFAIDTIEIYITIRCAAHINVGDHPDPVIAVLCKLHGSINVTRIFGQDVERV